MIKVTVIGSGNVAESLAIALSEASQKGIQLIEVAGRNPERVATVATLANCEVGDINNLKPADVYILSVSDDAVYPLFQSLQIPKNSCVVHSAGAIPMGELNGVLYPLQTFTKGRRVNFREVPLFVEGDPIIKQVALAISDTVMELDSKRRKALHISAVFACNFTNAMLTATHEILERNELSLSLFQPLVNETIEKAFDPTLTPKKAQTGAAKRGDTSTMSAHLKLLKGENDLIDIYKTISKYIWETSRKI